MRLLSSRTNVSSGGTPTTDCNRAGGIHVIEHERCGFAPRCAPLTKVRHLHMHVTARKHACDLWQLPKDAGLRILTHKRNPAAEARLHDTEHDTCDNVTGLQLTVLLTRGQAPRLVAAAQRWVPRPRKGGARWCHHDATVSATANVTDEFTYNCGAAQVELLSQHNVKLTGLSS